MPIRRKADKPFYSPTEQLKSPREDKLGADEIERGRTPFRAKQTQKRASHSASAIETIYRTTKKARSPQTGHTPLERWLREGESKFPSRQVNLPRLFATQLSQIPKLKPLQATVKKSSLPADPCPPSSGDGDVALVDGESLTSTDIGDDGKPGNQRERVPWTSVRYRNPLQLRGGGDADIDPGLWFEIHDGFIFATFSESAPKGMVCIEIEASIELIPDFDKGGYLFKVPGIPSQHDATQGNFTLTVAGENDGHSSTD